MRLFFSVLLMAILTSSAYAETFRPGLVIAGVKHDNGFNQMVVDGAARFQKEFGIRPQEVQASNDAQYLQALRALARRGANPVLGFRGDMAPWVEVVAKEFPKVRFILIDATAKGSNVQSIGFRDHEGAFLVGVAAAMKSKTRTIGFIGGMAEPTILAFACGYVQGARFADQQVKVLQNMVANTHLGFNDPARGVELARSQFERGVDVVFPAAMFTSLGVLQHARDAGKYSIGVDMNQNHRHPGSVLTSMVKRIDNVVYETLKTGMQGIWTPGFSTRGLKEHAVDWTLDKYNRALITPQMEQRINAAREQIISGQIQVVDYRTAHSCPVK